MVITMGDNDITFYTYEYNTASGEIIGVTAASNVLTITPSPESAKIDDKKEWRIRHSGSKYYPRARNRKRFKTKYTIDGKMHRSSFSVLRNMMLYKNRSWLIDGPFVINDLDIGAEDKPVVAMTALRHDWRNTFGGSGWIIKYTLVLDRVSPNVSNHFRS